VGEFLIMIAAFEHYQGVGLLLIPGVVLAAAYMLRLLQKLIWADSDGIYCLPVHAGDGFYVTLSDLSAREFCLMACLAIPVLWVGLYPGPLLEIMNCSVDNLLQYLPHAP
jgi:NADH-quinone oxidoreductase subunit M